MVFVKVLLVLLGVAYFECGAIKTLPNFVTPCKISGTDLSECYKNNIENLRPRLVKGIREFQILGFDPLHVTNMTLSRNDTRLMSYHVVLSNITLEGGKDFAIEDLKVNVDDPSFKLILRIPKTIMKSEFVITGVVLGFPVKGPGKAAYHFYDVLISYESKGEKITKKDNTYIDWNDGNIEVTYDNSTYQVEEILRNPDQLQLFNAALNENADLLHIHLAPALERIFGAYITEGLKQVHQLFPLNIIYLEK